MAIPLLGYPLSSQNGRVSNLAGDESTVRSQLYPSAAAGDDTNRIAMDALIEQAYRQVFFHAMRSDREPFLESQLRSGNITVRDFIRGLLLSERFQQGYYQCSSNYRMVDRLSGARPPVHVNMVVIDWREQPRRHLAGQHGVYALLRTWFRSRSLPGRAWVKLRSISNFRATELTGLSGTDPADKWASCCIPAADLGCLDQWPVTWLTPAIGGFELGRVLLTIAGEMMHT